MTTTLTNGTKIPERASRDWYSDLSTNWNLLDDHLGDTDSHLEDGLAPQATADASGNVITDTYATITDLSTLSDTVDTKADDDSVVHLTGEETITGDKTWTGSNTFSGTLTGTLTGLASQATADADGNTITSTYATKTELSTLSDTVDTKADDSDVVHIADEETITGAKTFSATLTSADVVPSATDTYSLGTSSNQWATLNGINPGALSLPSTSYTDIDTTDWSVENEAITWTAPLDGWLYIRVAGGADAWIVIRQVSINVKNPMSSHAGSSAMNNVSATIPVVAGRLYYIWLNSTAIQACEFVPCLGNV